MYATTDPRQIGRELETAGRTIAALTSVTKEQRTMAQEDALSAAVATVRAYADAIDSEGQYISRKAYLCSTCGTPYCGEYDYHATCTLCGGHFFIDATLYKFTERGAVCTYLPSSLSA